MSEADLYEPIKSWLDGDFPLVRKGLWHENHRRSILTAHLDWIDGGQWLRPDLALVHVHRRRFDPQPALDLYSIEVKPLLAAALAGLHQTLAHARLADFVLFVAPEQNSIGEEGLLQAQRFGVGVVTFRDARVWDTYRIRSSPRRMNPDPDLRDQFLTAALEAEAAVDEVLGWLGRQEGRRR